MFRAPSKTTGVEKLRRWLRQLDQLGCLLHVAFGLLVNLEFGRAGECKVANITIKALLSSGVGVEVAVAKYVFGRLASSSAVGDGELSFVGVGVVVLLQCARGGKTAVAWRAVKAAAGFDLADDVRILGGRLSWELRNVHRRLYPEALDVLLPLAFVGLLFLLSSVDPFCRGSSWCFC